MGDHRSAASSPARTPTFPRSTGAPTPATRLRTTPTGPAGANPPPRPGHAVNVAPNTRVGGSDGATPAAPREGLDDAPGTGATQPRARRREAVLDAAGDLLVTRGLVALTTRSVAARAGVSEAAVQRWWPTEEALALDALGHEWAALAGHIRRRAHGCGL
jgi:Bacterial regulatory proteins, tetR family